MTPTIRLRRLAAEMRRLREASGMTPRGAARGVHHLHRLRGRGPLGEQLRVAVRARPAPDRGLRRAVIRGVLPMASDHEVEQSVRARMDRQRLLDFPDPADPDVVYIDTLAGDLFLEKEAELRRYNLLFQHLRAVALSPDQSVRRVLRNCSRRSGPCPGGLGGVCPHG